MREELKSDSLEILATGRLPFLSDLNKQLEHDLMIAELVSMPLALLVGPVVGRQNVLDAALNIRDLETQHGLILPRDAGFETLAGFVLARLQRIPYLGESFDYEGHRYTVEDMDGHRIAKVKIEKAENAENKAESAKHAGD